MKASTSKLLQVAEAVLPKARGKRVIFSGIQPTGVPHVRSLFFRVIRIRLTVSIDWKSLGSINTMAKFSKSS